MARIRLTAVLALVAALAGPASAEALTTTTIKIEAGNKLVLEEGSGTARIRAVPSNFAELVGDPQVLSFAIGFSPAFFATDQRFTIDPSAATFCSLRNDGAPADDSAACNTAGLVFMSVRLGAAADSFTMEDDTPFTSQMLVGVQGGPGDDVLRNGCYQRHVELRGDDGADTILGCDSTAGETLVGGAGSDNINGHGGPDVLEGGPGGDSLAGGPGQDRVRFLGTTGVNVSLDFQRDDGAPGEGDLVQPDVEEIVGTPGADTLTGAATPNTINGAGGNDIIDGGGGADTLAGGAGDDVLSYTSAPARVSVDLRRTGLNGPVAARDTSTTEFERVSGSDFDDFLYGNAGANTLAGRGGHDRLSGGGGPDTLSGGQGDDTLGGGRGPGPGLLDSDADRLLGGSGRDTVSYLGRKAPVSVTLDDLANDGEKGEKDNVADTVEVILGGSGNDSLSDVSSLKNTILAGGPGNDLLGGGAGNDLLVGGAGADKLVGGRGKDLLSGASGADKASGGSGDDFLGGGAGSDRLDGGAGNDVVVSRGQGHDTVRCGKGSGDAVIGDRRDRRTGCDLVRASALKQTALTPSNTPFGMSIAELNKVTTQLGDAFGAAADTGVDGGEDLPLGDEGDDPCQGQPPDCLLGPADEIIGEDLVDFIDEDAGFSEDDEFAGSSSAGGSGLRVLTRTAKPNAKGTLTFKVKCSKNADETCFGTAELRPKKGKRIGKAKPYAIARGQTLKLKMKLSRKLARRAKTKRLVLKLVLNPVGDEVKTINRTVTVGKQRKKKR